MCKKNPTTPSLIADLKNTIQQEKESNDRQFVTALGRGLILLAAFEYKEELSHQQLCQMSNLPKATVTRLIATLITLDFLRITDKGQYQLGSSAIRLSVTALNRHDIVDLATPLLKQFASDHKVSLNLATEIAGEMRYLACCRSPARLSVNLQVGSAVPVVETAIGRAFFAASTPARQTIIKNTLKNRLTVQAYKQAQAALDDAVAYYKKNGYTLSDGEFSDDILAVAVPVLDVTTRQYGYSLNASVPRANWDAEEYADAIVDHLKVLAKKIES